MTTSNCNVLNNFVVLGTISIWNNIIDKVNKFYADYSGNLTLAGVLTATGDIVYNSGKSLTSQMATLNGYKTSGTFASTTSWQTIYTMNYSSGSRGFITVYGQFNGPNYGMITCFFDGVNNISYPSLTQIACSGNGAQL